jgi:lipopolysaccharide transport system permease protein
VFFEAKLFRNAGVGFLVDWNPVYYVLDIIRAPFLAGQIPSSTTWIWFGGCLILTALWALRVVSKSERSLVFYL